MTPGMLREWRKKHGFRQVELAMALGVRNETVSRWERGTREIPSFLHLALIGVLTLEKRKSLKKGSDQESQLDLIG